MIHFPIITEFSLPSIILIPDTPSSQRLEMLRLKFVMTVGFLRLSNWMCVLIKLELISLIIENRKSCLINRNLVLDGQKNEDSVTSETFFKCVCGSVVEFIMYDVQNQMGWQSYVSLPRWGFYRCEKRRRVSSIQEFIQVKIGETKRTALTHHQVWDENSIIKSKGKRTHTRRR